MDVFEAIKKRRSIRKFLKKKVDDNKIYKILEAAHAAPNAGNLQAWRFIVVKDRSKIELLAQAAHEQIWLETAPVLIVVVGNIDTIKRMYAVRGERFYSIQDCAAATTNAILAAEALGLSTCWIGAFDEGEVRRFLDIPESSRPQTIIALGYQDEFPPKPAKVDLKRVVFFEKYGNVSQEKQKTTLDEKYEAARKKIGESLRKIRSKN